MYQLNCDTAKIPVVQSGCSDIKSRVARNELFKNCLNTYMLPEFYETMVETHHYSQFDKGQSFCL